MNIEVAIFRRRQILKFDLTIIWRVKGVVQARYANTIRDHVVHERSNQAEAFRANDTQFMQDANNLLFQRSE